MKSKMLMGIVAVTLMCITLIGCIGGTPTPPVSKAEHVDKLIVEDMTLDEVYALMTEELRGNTVLYPAQSLELRPNGNWKVAAKDGGFEEDEEPPFQVLMLVPETADRDYYIIFFEGENVIGNNWFAVTAAGFIEGLLTGEDLTQ